MPNMSSSDAANQQGDDMRELRHHSVEETRRMIAEATVAEIRPPTRRIDLKDPSNYVIVPLPEIGHRKSNECSSGKEIKVTVNCYPITKVPKKPVYMYEVRKVQKL